MPVTLRISSIILLITLAVNMQSQGQIIFKKVKHPIVDSNFSNLSKSAVAVADMDGDGDRDVLMCGINSKGDRTTRLHENHQNGSYYTLKDHSLPAVSNGDLVFTDLNGDQVPDILLSGVNNEGEAVTRFFINDGTGQFNPQENGTIPGFKNTTIDVADVNGNGSRDVVIAGELASGQLSTHLYINDGSGHFNLRENTPFPGMRNGDLELTDLSGNNHPDLLITGRTMTDGSLSDTTALYINDGNGQFTYQSTGNVPASQYSSLSAADIDKDDDMDVVISGMINNTIETRLLINDGNAGFTPADTLDAGQIYGDVILKDVNQDSLPDLFTSDARFYLNDGNGGFTLQEGVGFPASTDHAMMVADMNGDNYKDLIFTGSISNSEAFSMIYENDTSGDFHQASHLRKHFKGIKDVYNNSDIALADIDGDNDKDMVISGYDSASVPGTQVYEKLDNGLFERKHDTVLQDMAQGVLAFADVDNDDDQDLIMSGLNPADKRFTHLYTNDGSGHFSLADSSSFPGLLNGNVIFEDVDTNGTQDVIMSGKLASGELATRFYTNNGNGDFTLVNDHPFPDANGNMTFADLNGDNTQDLLIAGSSESWALYINDGRGNFSHRSVPALAGIHSGSVAHADIDDDQDQDLLITGLFDLDTVNEEQTIQTRLYTNDGNAGFQPVDTFQCQIPAESGFADFDNDGDPDIMLSTGQLYENDGNGNFDEHTTTATRYVLGNAQAFHDYNDDGYMDVLIAGNKKGGLFENITGCGDLNVRDTIRTCNQSFTWGENGQTYTRDGIYQQVYTNTAGCDSVVALDLRINAPDTAVTRDNNKLTANAGDASFRWLDCNDGFNAMNVDSSTFAPASSGSYAVEITKNGCTDTSACYQVVVSGTSPEAGQADIHLYPNPSSGQLHIHTPKDAGRVKVTISNAIGTLIKQRTYPSGNIDLKLAQASGIYIVRVHLKGNKPEVFRVMKE